MDSPRGVLDRHCTELAITPSGVPPTRLNDEEARAVCVRANLQKAEHPPEGEGNVGVNVGGCTWVSRRGRML